MSLPRVTYQWSTTRVDHVPSSPDPFFQKTHDFRLPFGYTLSLVITIINNQNVNGSEVHIRSIPWNMVGKNHHPPSHSSRAMKLPNVSCIKEPGPIPIGSHRELQEDPLRKHAKPLHQTPPSACVQAAAKQVPNTANRLVFRNRVLPLRSRRKH